MEELIYPYPERPANGSVVEVVPGVRWIRMPLPMSLNHVNLYLIEDDAGWAVVDTGMFGDHLRDLWHRIIREETDGAPLTRVLVTHMHPDHVGQAAWLTNEHRLPLYMTASEFYQARAMLFGARSYGGSWQAYEYFGRQGLDVDSLMAMNERFRHMMPAARSTASEPHGLDAFIRVRHGDVLAMGGARWQVWTGAGHSPEHLCLYDPERRLLLSGDQILPEITSNVSVHPTEPEANPLALWLESLARFEAIPDDVLVLPAHNLPFRGLHYRLSALANHHEDRMLAIEESCVEPRTAVSLLPVLFERRLDGHNRMMALGECVAHLHLLMRRGRIERTLSAEGVYDYRSIDPTLPVRTRSGHHDDRDAGPMDESEDLALS